MTKRNSHCNQDALVLRLERERIIPEIPKTITVIRRILLLNEVKVEAKNRVITLRLTVKTPKPKSMFCFILTPPFLLIKDYYVRKCY